MLENHDAHPRMAVGKERSEKEGKWKGGKVGFVQICGNKEGRSEGTHSSGAHKTDQLGDVNQANGENGQEGLCVEMRSAIIGFGIIAGVVVV